MNKTLVTYGSMFNQDNDGVDNDNDEEGNGGCGCCSSCMFENVY